jgi:hypothetical protein
MLNSARGIFRRFALLLAISFGTATGLPAAAQGLLPVEYDRAIPTLEQVTGHETGENITSPDEMVAYLQALEAADPARVRIVEYARSWQDRPLVYAVIGSPERMNQLASLKADIARLASGAPLPASERDALIARTPAVAWLGFGVHGDEITPGDSALALAYHLLAAKNDPLVAQILAETIVIIDPAQNPDGRARFIHSNSEATGLDAQADRSTAEHDQPWPGGRFNHYLMDMNRDWFALTQPETRGRVAALQEWHPVVFVDSHEMGGDETYFFPPPADPLNPFITPAQRSTHDAFGRNRGAWFDRFGIAYFTREIFDAFYPGYGDMWPTLNGTIAKTFEQGSPRGLVFLRRTGETLTFKEGVFNNFIASLATLETTANERAKLLSDYAAFRRSAVEEGARASDRFYIIDRSVRRGQAERLAETLTAQGIAVSRLPEGARACGKTYADGALVIDKAQPAGRLARTLLDPDTPLPPDFIERQEARRKAGLAHELYDVTAWTLPLMEDVQMSRCKAVDLAGAVAWSKEGAPDETGTLAPGFGYAVPWTDAVQARFVFAALKDGLIGSTTDKAFTLAGRTYGKGTVIFPAAGNPADMPERLARLAGIHGAEVVTLASSWAEAGPNFGSGSFVRLKSPSIALAWDEGTVSTSAGATRWVIERKFGVPVAAIRVRTLGSADLTAYDVLIIPETSGAFERPLGPGGMDALKGFVRQGGVLVALGSATAVLASEEAGLLSTAAENAWQEDPQEAKPEERQIGTRIADAAAYEKMIADPKASPEDAPGALVRVEADADHWLSSGYDRAIALVTGSQIYKPLNKADGTNVLRFAAAGELVASGYMWKENIEQLAYKPYLMASPSGDGLVIAFTQSPTTRGYLGGLDLLLANAILLAPARTAAGAAR